MNWPFQNVCRHPTFGLYEFGGIEVNFAIPCNCAEGHPDILEMLMPPYSLKHPTIQTLPSIFELSFPSALGTITPYGAVRTNEAALIVPPVKPSRKS